MRTKIRAAFVGLGLSVLTIVAAAAKPVTNVLDHKDWIGVCDNTLRCTAMALAPDGEARAYLAIIRDGDPAALPTLRVVIYSDDNVPSGPVHLHAAGFDADVAGRWDDGGIVASSKDQALIGALVRLGASDAKTLQVSIAKAGAPISLSGAAAALLWMDDRQGRLGSVSALTRKGPRPLSEMPPAPPLPVIVAAAKGSAVEIKPVVFPKTLLARPELKDCDKAQLNEVDERGAWRLGSDLILWSVPCTLGAYNLDTLFFLSDAHRAGSERRQFLSSPPPIPPNPTPTRPTASSTPTLTPKP